MEKRIVEEVLDRIKNVVPDLDKITVKKIVIGLGYTAATLSTGHSGLCYTFQNEIAHATSHCQVSDSAGTLAGTKAFKLAEKAKSWEISECIVGFAVLNALSQIVIEKNPDKYVITIGDALDQVKLTKKDVVAMVGNIGPLVPAIKEKAKKLYILERTPARRIEGVFPDVACDQILPTADVVLITGTTIANGTIDHLLSLSKNAKEVAIIGASAGILPDVLFERGVTVIGGAKIVDADKMMQVVAEGGGTPALKKAIDFINIKPKA